MVSSSGFSRYAPQVAATNAQPERVRSLLDVIRREKAADIAVPPELVGTVGGSPASDLVSQSSWALLVVGRPRIWCPRARGPGRWLPFYLDLFHRPLFLF